MPLFDVNAMIGRPAHPHFGSWLDAGSLIAEMDRFCIERALVSHVWGCEVSTALGNRAVTEETRPHDRLVPVWTLQPSCEDEGRTVHEQVEAATAEGRVGAVRLEPWPTLAVLDVATDPRDFRLHTAVVAEVCRELEDVGLPLLVDINQTDWPELYGLCETYPELPIVLLNMKFMHQRSLYAGLRTYSNLHFEISGYHVHRGLEDLHATFGPRQILFGTRLPEFTASSSVSMLLYADIPDEAKRAIGGENLHRLLRGGRGAWSVG